MKALALLVTLLVVTAGCGGSSHDKAEQSTPFAYDASAPLDYADHGVVNHGYPIVVDLGQQLQHVDRAPRRDDRGDGRLALGRKLLRRRPGRRC